MALSAPLSARQSVLKVKAETTKGTKVAGDVDILAFNAELKPATEFEQRLGSGKVFGNTSPGILGARAGVCTFQTELKGTDSAALDTGLVALLQGCGVLQATQVYTPLTAHATQKCLSIDLYEAGRKKSLAGAMGTAQLNYTNGKRVLIDWTFSGVWQAPVDVSLPTPAHSAIVPVRMNAAAGAFTLAGEAIKVANCTFDLGNSVVPREDVAAAGGIAYFMIDDRDPTFRCDPEADLVAGYDFYGAWLAGTEVAVALTGTNGTDTFALAIAKLQYRELSGSMRNKTLTEDLLGQCNINAIGTGDDEWSLTIT